MNEDVKNSQGLLRSGSRVKLFFLWLLVVGVIAAELAITEAAFKHGASSLVLIVLALSFLITLAFAALLMICIFTPVRFRQWLLSPRISRRLAFALVCFVTFVALFYAVENWRGKRVWESHKREQEANGEKFTIAELAPPAVPDEQNFAMTPLLRPLLDFFRDPNGNAVWRDTNGLARLRALHADAQMDQPTNRLVLGSFERGTFADLAAWREFYRGNTNYPPLATSGTAAETILTALGKFDPELKELREAAARPHSRFPIEYDYQPAWGILLPHLVHLKALTVLTSVRATAELEAGRAADAFADLKLGCRIADSIGNEPILVDHLVRIAALAVNLQTVREGLVRHAWTDVQLIELEKYFAELDLLAEYKLSMRGERALSTSGLDWMRGQGFRGNSMDYLSSDGGSTTSGNLNPMPGGWFFQNMVTISKLEQDYVLAAVDEKERRVFPEKCDNLDVALSQRPTGPYNIFAKLLIPALRNATRKSARMQTFVNAARVACALERHRIANGALPESLDVLTPRFIEKIPNDVIDGKPLRYHRDADGGYVLYSIGWNKADDGGEIVLAKGTDPGIDLTKGDWVWQMPGK